MDIMLGFEPSGVGSIPAGPAKYMIITPIFLKKKFYKKDFVFKEGPPVQVLDPISVLEQFDLLDLKNEIEMLGGHVSPYGSIYPHKDGPPPNGLPLLWSILFLAEEDKNDTGVELEIYVPKKDATSIFLEGPVGNKKITYNPNDCDVIEIWNFKMGECYFNPTDYWHGARNYSNKAQDVFSLRSSTIEIDEVLNRIT